MTSLTHRIVVSPNGGCEIVETEEAATSMPKPPSIYHNYRGDVRSQDIFVEEIEAHRRKGEKHAILYPGSDDFELERLDMFNHDDICTPSLIVQPRNTAEVSSCIRGYSAGVRRCLSQNRRSKSNLEIPRLCVAGGRNSIAAIKGGAIVLDLSLMKRVKVDKEAQTATVQGGARILDLDRATGDYGLMCVAGACQNLGVVGCILGGGIGYASRKHGLACDNVLAAQIVLADGSVKRCSSTNRPDLLFSLLGGGGGICVVTSVTLRCFPLRNAAVVTCQLFGATTRARRSSVLEWARWINSSKDGESAPDEVSSQLVLPTKSSAMPCIASSIDSEVIPQSEEYLELYRDMTSNKNRNGLFGRKKKHNDSRLPISIDRVPGLCDLEKSKVGSRMRNADFQMVRYHELQKIGDKFTQPGNVFVAYKYARTLTNPIVQLLAMATTGNKTPNAESRITISSAGGATTEGSIDQAAFDNRGMKFFIFIEGRWSESTNDNRDSREKRKVIKWVRWVSKSLQLCEHVRSTAHPESMRDPGANESERNVVPEGFYNFGRNGSKLAGIKKEYDPRNVFSLASRVSWNRSASFQRHQVTRIPSSRSYGDPPSLAASTDDDASSESASKSSEESHVVVSPSLAEDDELFDDDVVPCVSQEDFEEWEVEQEFDPRESVYDSDEEVEEFPDDEEPHDIKPVETRETADESSEDEFGDDELEEFIREWEESQKGKGEI